MHIPQPETTIELVYSPKMGNPKKPRRYSPATIVTTPPSPMSTPINWEHHLLERDDVNDVDISLTDSIEQPRSPLAIHHEEQSIQEILEPNATTISSRFARYPFLKKCVHTLITYRSLWVLLLVLIGFCFGFHMGFTVLLGCAVLILIDRQEMDATFMKIDWNLLVFFGSLFILVNGFGRMYSQYALKAIQPFLATTKDPVKLLLFTILVLVGSNILSNVPLVLLLSDPLKDQLTPTFTWMLMAFVSTIAGNFTLLGSVANLIVAEKAKQYYQIGFWEFFKVGAVSTILVIAAGVPLIVLVG